MPAAAGWSGDAAPVCVDQRNPAHGLTATTDTVSTGRRPHRVERSPIAELAAPSVAAAVTAPLDGRVFIHRVGWSEATAMSNSPPPEKSPCHVVASPSRIVECPSRSSNVGGDEGRVSNDHTVTTASGVAITSRSGRRAIKANMRTTTAPTAERKYATLGRHAEFASVTAVPTRTPGVPAPERKTAPLPRPSGPTPRSSTSPVSR